MAEQFAKERDEAFIDFVTTGSTKKLMAYCRKYRVPVPRDEKIMAAGVYKAVQECTNIPEDVKRTAREKCRQLGMSPYFNRKDDGL